MSTQHVDVYEIQYFTFECPLLYKVYEDASLNAPTPKGKAQMLFSEIKDCWSHGHSYVYYTQPHEDGECPEPPRFESHKAGDGRAT